MADKRIIVIDDDDLMRRATNPLPRAHGYSVDCFVSAEAFLEYGTERDATCLLADIRPGSMSGMDLRRNLRASGVMPSVIFMTAFDSESAYHEAFEAGRSLLVEAVPTSILIDAIGNASAARTPDPYGFPTLTLRLAA